MDRRTLLVASVAAVVALAFAGSASAQTAVAAPAAQQPVTPVSSTTAVPAVAPTPTTKDLLQKYAAALGDSEAWAKFTTRYIKGIYQTEDASGFASVEIFSKAPNKMLTKITFPNGLVLRQVCDGKSAWLEDPVGGMHSITGPGLESRLRTSNFDERATVLLMAVTGRVVGKEHVGTHDTYVLEFSPFKGLKSKLYFDQESGLAVRVDDNFHLDDGDYKVETYVDDFRLVDGAYFPFRIRHVEKGNVFTIRVTQVKNNYAVDDSLFFKPVSAPK